MQAATVACRQLGYDLGAKHFDVGQNQMASFRNLRQGLFYDLDTESRDCYEKNNQSIRICG